MSNNKKLIIGSVIVFVLLVSLLLLYTRKNTKTDKKMKAPLIKQSSGNKGDNIEGHKKDSIEKFIDQYTLEI